MNTYFLILVVLLLTFLVLRKTRENFKIIDNKTTIVVYNSFNNESKNNFGDAVNNIFWNKITNKNINYKSIKNNNYYKNIHFITTGSIMHLLNNKSIILGTGCISDDIKYIPKYKPIVVISVRGPLTRNVLLNNGINCPEIYGDPLIMMPCIYDKYKSIKDNVIGIIPHYKDKNNKLINILKKNLENNNLTVKIIDINIGSNYKKLIDEINNCKYIISSSLHGIIMGVVYNKKTIFLEFSNKVIGNKFKFYDFFKSLDINYSYRYSINIDILNNYIKFDYKNLFNNTINLINVIPFISKTRKIQLFNVYNKFYKNISFNI